MKTNVLLRHFMSPGKLHPTLTLKHYLLYYNTLPHYLYASDYTGFEVVMHTLILFLEGVFPLSVTQITVRLNIFDLEKRQSS